MRCPRIAHLSSDVLIESMPDGLSDVIVGEHSLLQELRADEVHHVLMPVTIVLDERVTSPSSSAVEFETVQVALVCQSVM